MMKQLLTGVAIAAMCVGMALSTTAADAADLGGKVLKVGSDTTNPPLESVDTATKQIVGFDVDVVNAICAKINCKAEFVTTAWDGIFAALQGGNFDLVASDVSITDERKKQMDFTNPYLEASESIMVRVADQNLTVDEIKAKHKKLSAQTGTTDADLAVELVGRDNASLYDNFTAVVSALKNGDVDGAVIGTTNAQAYEKQFAGELVIAAKGLKADHIGLVFRQGDANVEAFNEGLKQIQDDGTLDKLVARYWGPK
jgi:polar amino acid transport system substrate-binding protein